MPFRCKGICLKLRPTGWKLHKRKFGLYAQGFKRCNTCHEFITWNLIRCPCCGNRLSTRPSKNKIIEERLYL